MDIHRISVFLGVFIVAFCLVHTDEALAVARVLTVAVFALALGYLVVNEYRSEKEIEQEKRANIRGNP